MSLLQEKRLFLYQINRGKFKDVIYQYGRVAFAPEEKMTVITYEV